jgi:hypothetical protein
MRSTAMILALALPAFIFDTWERPAPVRQADVKAAPAGAAAENDANLPVGFDMQNVHLHVSDRAALDVAWLHGRLRTEHPGQPIVFDDQQSFRIEIDDAELAIDAGSLTALVNRAFDYTGSSLSNLRVSFENNLLVQRGTLHKGVNVPFTVRASVSATPDGQLRIHPEKVKTAGIPSTKLMALFGIELDDIVRSRPDRGVVLRDNDMIVDPAKMLPPPRTLGRLTSAFVRGNRLVQVFGRGQASRPRAVRGNYIWFRGGIIRFGKLTMTGADLELIDKDPTDPFDFFTAQYNRQLVAGYSKNTPQHGLRTYMPDYGDIHKAQDNRISPRSTLGDHGCTTAAGAAHGRGFHDRVSQLPEDLRRRLAGRARPDAGDRAGWRRAAAARLRQQRTAGA